MQDTQVFRWATDDTVAILEVRHHKCEMLLMVVAGIAEEVRAKMLELNEGGMYPNEEITSEGGLLAQFIISCGQNWNVRWRDFKKVLDRILGTLGIEFWGDGEEPYDEGCPDFSAQVLQEFELGDEDKNDFDTLVVLLLRSLVAEQLLEDLEPFDLEAREYSDDLAEAQEAREVLLGTASQKVRDAFKRYLGLKIAWYEAHM